MFRLLLFRFDPQMGWGERRGIGARVAPPPWMLRSTAYQPLPPSPPPHNRSPFHYSPLSPLPSSLGLFPHPPAPATFQATDELQLLRDLLSIEPIIILNAAMCRRHLAKCPPSAELERECAKAKALEAEFDDRMAKLLENLPDPCQNLHQKCEEWAMAGECAKNPSYMMTTCIKACGFCNPGADGVVVVETDKHGLDREQVAGRAQDVPLARIRGERDGDGFTVDDYDDGRDDEEPTVSVAQDEATIARLLVRCRESAPTWTAHEVTECVELARCVFMCCVWTLGDEWMRPAPPLRAHVLTPPTGSHSLTHAHARSWNSPGTASSSSRGRRRQRQRQRQRPPPPPQTRPPQTHQCPSRPSSRPT